MLTFVWQRVASTTEPAYAERSPGDDRLQARPGTRSIVSALILRNFYSSAFAKVCRWLTDDELVFQ